MLKEGVISIASILNKHNSGVLYFGVKDNGDVKGQEVGKETQRDISRAISGNIKPECLYEIHLRNTVEGESFIEVSFSGKDAPYYWCGTHYRTERMRKKHYWGTSMPYRIPVAGSRECIAEDAGSNQTF